MTAAAQLPRSGLDGELMARRNTDLWQIGRLVEPVPDTLTSAAMLIATFCLRFVADSLLALCAVASLPVLAIAARGYSRYLPAWQYLQRQLGTFSGVRRGHVSGIRFVKGWAQSRPGARMQRIASEVYEQAVSSRAHPGHLPPPVEPGSGGRNRRGHPRRRAAGDQRPAHDRRGSRVQRLIARHVWPVAQTGAVIGMFQRCVASAERVGGSTSFGALMGDSRASRTPPGSAVPPASRCGY